MSEIKLALVSVYNKDKLEYLGEQLSDRGYIILSSGGTARKLREFFGNNPNVLEVSDYTNFPESPGGLVKTLQGKIHGGILMDPKNPEHAVYMLKNGIFPIDFVAVNLYPFAETIEKNPNMDADEAAKEIDIGGPTMLRSAAKSLLLYGNPPVVCDPKDYGKALKILSNKVDSKTQVEMELEMAKKVFAYTAEYDKTIEDFLQTRKV